MNSIEAAFDSLYINGGRSGSFTSSAASRTRSRSRMRGGAKSKSKPRAADDDSKPRFKLVTKAVDGEEHIAKNHSPSKAAKKLAKYLFQKAETGKKTVTIEGISRVNKGKKYVYDATKRISTDVPPMMKERGIKKITDISVKSKN